MKNPTRMSGTVEMPEGRSRERAVCELCGHVIATTNGGLHTPHGFVTFEKLLDLHMEQRHANLCILPDREREELKQVA